VRVLVLTPAFHSERRLYARQGSPEDAHMRRALRQLADERIPVPGPDDKEALRTPFGKIWARPVPGTNLVITFVITPRTLDVTGVRPAFREVR
jgi:hypothetical protein